MFEYVNNSRIDGYPIVKVSNDNNGELYLDYFESLNDMYGTPIKIKHVTMLDDRKFDNYFFVKICLSFEKFHDKLIEYKKLIRMQKIEQIDEYITDE